MAIKCAPRKPSRHFAEGGVVNKADQLMAEMAAKYGVTGQAQATTVQQQAPQTQPQPKAPAAPQQQGLTGGIIGILKGRSAQVDKAAGYANGGKIEGPGTPKSDSIPATVRETSEGIKVSTKERILSVEQDAYLGSVAKAAGYDSLDQMLEDGTGKPVGPTIKSGKRAAEDGMAPVEEERTKAAIVAPPTLGAAPFSRSEPAGMLNGPASGITADPFGPSSKVGSGLAGQDVTNSDAQFMTGKTPGAAPEPFQKPGRDAAGIITADSAQAAEGSGMQRSGGVFGSIDMKGANEIMARENKARGEMIDLSIAANGGNSIAILGDGGIEAANAEKTARWRQDDLIDRASRGNQGAVSAAINANATADAEAGRSAVATRGQDLTFASATARQGITARGQDLAHERGTERNDIVVRGQDKRAETSANRLTSNEAIAAARISEQGGPSLAQQRGNAEIDAARQSIAGLTPDEIKRKTAKTTNTGRENPDFDPTLERAASLANRRKVGADDHFDQRQQAQPQQPAAGTAAAPAYDRADIANRFRSERSMDSHKLGNDTPNGVEVLDASGKVIGHYR